ncbi:MAG TPA: restriction endonuclease subunit R [Thermoanaerobaculia bacterium]
MAKVPARVAARITSALKRFQPILAAAKARDVNESDTVVVVTDLLQEVFGYDKYADITSEHMIRSTFCDLAIKVASELQVLLEVKAIGLDLKDQHVKQAVDYAANQGAEWVGLTNGVQWRVYKVIFGKPLQQELVVEFDLLAMNPKDAHDVEMLSLLAKESWTKAKLGEYASLRQALSRFFLGAVVLSEPVLEVVRRELRRLNPDVRIGVDEIASALRSEVLKRDVIEGESAELARRQVARAASRRLRSAGEDAPAVREPNA